MTYWVNSYGSGEAKGPYTMDQLRSMWQHGVLTADASFYDFSAATWKPLRALLELQPPSTQSEQLRPLSLARSDLRSMPSLPAGYEYPDGLSESLRNDDYLSFLEYLFTPKGRIGRLEIFAGNLLYLVGIGCVVGILNEVSKNNNPPPLWITPISACILALWVWCSLMLVAKRLHDSNISGWVGLLSLVPFLNIGLGLMLLFYPGTNGPNKYGYPRNAFS